MFLSLDSSSPIIGMDYSYSDERRKKVSVYFKSMHSMIVDPFFLELIAMMNGLFDRESIVDYAENSHSYDNRYINDILNKMLSWGVASEASSACLWSTPFDKDYSADCFKRFDVRFLSVTPVLIDLSLLLCKYSFKSISFTDPEIRVKQEDVDSSALLQKSDVGRLLSDLIAIRRDKDHTNGDSNNGTFETERHTIFMCDGCSRDFSDDCSILLDANDYRNNMKLCRGFAFDLSCNEKRSDAKFAELEHTLKMESDVVFGVVDGFYS